MKTTINTDIPHIQSSTLKKLRVATASNPKDRIRPYLKDRNERYFFSQSFFINTSITNIRSIKSVEIIRKDRNTKTPTFKVSTLPKLSYGKKVCVLNKYNKKLTDVKSTRKFTIINFIE